MRARRAIVTPEDRSECARNGLPLLDFSGGLPPYLVRVAWSNIFLVYAAFAGILFAVTFGTTAFLGRERLSTIVKLGDA